MDVFVGLVIAVIIVASIVAIKTEKRLDKKEEAKNDTSS